MKSLLLASAASLAIGTVIAGTDIRSIADTPKPLTIPNPQIDYAGFQKIVEASGTPRERNRLTEDQFLAAMEEKGVVILDARSANMYKLRHIKGAINLPFTDFTTGSLAAVVPTKDTHVVIYCNNNFAGAPVSFTSKTATASLNLSTYTSLVSYGYGNLSELGPLLDVKTTKIPFEGTELEASYPSFR